MPESDPSLNETILPTQVALASSLTTTAVIGPYHLLQKIAEGGMGEVWLAEQKQPVRRRVALKLIKPGMDSREILLRFDSERQAIALMNHPAIAKVYDVGSTVQGRPYFAMEFVPGLPISDYCDTHKLSVRQRLQLFIQVCEGVQHAHQKAILHRDLKPSNILVSEIDGRPAPKIIDFGVAKALSHGLTEQTMFTRIGSILGTPEYMSPEQADSGGEDIDTRTDVYSLGVILYELLAGVTPLDLKSTSYIDMVRKIREQDTPKPSTRIRSPSAVADHAATSRGTERSALIKELRGDLDCIALKCLEKDRGRRYASPSELAADIDRYLSNLPVLAAPPSNAYRLRKFAQRNRGVLAAVCAVFIALTAGVLISVYQAIRARNAEHAAILQRDRADAEAATAQAVNDFLQNDLLSQAGADAQRNPDAAPDPDVKVRTLVDRSAAAVPAKFHGRPAVEADLHKTIGETYLSLGLLDQAHEQLRQAYEVGKDARGPDAKETIEALQSLGTVDFNAGRYTEAAKSQQTALDSARRAFGPESPLVLIAMQSLAVDYMMMGEREKAEPLLKSVLQRYLQNGGYDKPDILDTSDSLATLYIIEGRYGEAEKLLEQGLQTYQKIFGPEHPNTMRERFGLARVLFGTGQYSKGEELASAVYRSNQKLLGDKHFKTLSAARLLARIYAENEKLPDAEALLRDTLAKQQANSMNESTETIATKEALAAAYEKEHEYGRAEELRRQTVRAADRVFGASHPDALASLQLLGRNLLAQHQCQEAAQLLKSANEKWQARSSPDWQRFQAQALLGEALACQQKFSEALPFSLSGSRGLAENARAMPAYQQGVVKEAADNLALVQAALK